MKILNFGKKYDSSTGVLESGMHLLSSPKLLSRLDRLSRVQTRAPRRGGGEQAKVGSHM